MCIRDRLRVDAHAQRRGGRRGGGQGVQAVQLTEAVGVDGDAEGERLAQLGGGLGGRVQHGTGRRHTGRAGQRQFAGAGHLAAQPLPREQAQYGDERGGLDGEGVQDRRAGRGELLERGAQFGGGPADSGDVQEPRDGVGRAHQPLGDGCRDGAVPQGGVGGRRGRGRRGGHGTTPPPVRRGRHRPARPAGGVDLSGRRQ